jgi:hypothetical protein
MNNDSRDSANKLEAHGSARKTRGPENPCLLSGTDEYQQMVAEAAFFNAERRAFAPGKEMTDWLQAEAGVDVRSHGGH